MNNVGRWSCRNRATSSGQPAGGSPVRGDARVPGSAAPGGGRDPGVEAEQRHLVKGVATGRSAASSEVCGVVRETRVSGTRGSRAGTLTAKATDSTREPGAGAQEPSGVWEVERSEGCLGNWREPPRPRPVGWEAMSAYNQANPGKWRGRREAVGGGSSSPRAGKPSTWRRAPASSMHRVVGRGSDECPNG